MDFQIVWTEQALADLEAVVRQVAVGNLAAAEKLRLELLGSIEVLRQFPYIGPLYERDRTRRARQILCHRYRIFYRVHEANSHVEVLTVWHGSRKEPKLPR